MHRLFLALALVFALGHSPHALAAQEATPSSLRAAMPEGLLAQANKQYNVSGTRLVGRATMVFIVAEFNTDEHAEQGLPWASDIVLASLPGEGNLVPASAPTFGDATRAYTGKVENEGTAFDAAVLAFRDGRYVHVWFAAGRAADPLLDLTAVAERLLQEASQGRATPESELLLDRLPTLRDMPTGFVLVKQDVSLVAQPVATPSR